eukprot:CAMPEP_0177465476 /NCGR_PEP_ID=MMETSP0369-20130122/17434_1 /TAXON_ID=447022 ORGANISM="Scrippsiella hangoei-like, Strain SHHI-4" /NCGR_SAMPLE_ID=MMETSP0369 /ASSEMBLY_ACC=CAM_ASM_000364 /LENGTH=288 /DNA_ID=CAMNT_0018939363 /DNA_START=52 /DNA_END=915 /DNA_ORIENTATION=+
MLLVESPSPSSSRIALLVILCGCFHVPSDGFTPAAHLQRALHRLSLCAGQSSGEPRVYVETIDEGQALVVDGTFASLYRPGKVSTNCVWDALAAPMLALPQERRRRVLLLGLGGGSVARIVRALAPEAEIVGVELDAEVIAVAREHFGLDDMALEIIEGDALEFLRSDTRSFDYIVDDVFIGDCDTVRRPDWFPFAIDLECERLRTGGVLVSNSIDEHKAVARHLRGHLRRGNFGPEGTLVRVDVKDYSNHIFALGPPSLSGSSLREAVGSNVHLAESLEVLSFCTVE